MCNAQFPLTIDDVHRGSLEEWNSSLYIHKAEINKKKKKASSSSEIHVSAAHTDDDQRVTRDSWLMTRDSWGAAVTVK